MCGYVRVCTYVCLRAFISIHSSYMCVLCLHSVNQNATVRLCFDVRVTAHVCSLNNMRTDHSSILCVFVSVLILYTDH